MLSKMIIVFQIYWKVENTTPEQVKDGMIFANNKVDMRNQKWMISQFERVLNIIFLIFSCESSSRRDPVTNSIR